MTILSTISPQHPLLLIGCGKMGGALLQGWLNAGLSAQSVKIIDPYVATALKQDLGILESNFVENLSDLPLGLAPGFVILAVKPQMMDQALEGLKALDCGSSVFLSIAAGKTIGFFEKHLGQDAAIVRSMPNTPAAIGKGITVCCPNKNVTDKQKAVCHDLLCAAGAVDWVDDEGLIDAVTAVSGSGPAYVFNMVEALAVAGQAVGLNKDLARKLAKYTICGAGALLEQSEEDATQLRINVTSPKGTTEAALKILMRDDGLEKLMTEAVQAAYQRSKELAE